jgi:hypothetical protein
MGFRLFPNKKGFELSINFIVILVIAIVIFAGGIFLTNKFFKLAGSHKKQIDHDTQTAIENLLNSGSKVAVPVYRKEITRGGGDVFGIGIRNTEDVDKFHVIASFDEAYGLNNERLSASRTYINDNWIIDDLGTIEIDNNMHDIELFIVEVQGNMAPHTSTKKGTYIFNICVCKTQCDGTCDSGGGITTLYDGHIHKVYVQAK